MFSTYYRKACHHSKELVKNIRDPSDIKNRLKSTTCNVGIKARTFHRYFILMLLFV